ncbi:MAG: zinc ribbon domain-containing protein [Pseudomonadota bacterium]
MGFMTCADCGHPLSYCKSRGRYGRYEPYYLCHTKGCVSYGKSIRQAQLEGDFAALITQMRASVDPLALVFGMLKDAREMRRAQATDSGTYLRRGISYLERKIEECLDSADGGSTTVIKAFGRRIEKLEADMLKVRESSNLSISHRATQRGF